MAGLARPKQHDLTTGSSRSSSSTARPWTTPSVGHASVPSSSGERPRVLITGASGLLGQQVLRQLDVSSWEVLALGFSRAQRVPLGLGIVEECDLIADGAASKWVQEFAPHVVLHLAAERRGEILSRSPAAAEMLNVQATAELVEACERQGSWFLMVSCDHVFSGFAPPYNEASNPDPVTTLGQQKHRAEVLALRHHKRAAILRVQDLYGPVEDLRESMVTSLFADLRRGLRRADDRHLRYPTFAPDVAGVIRCLLELHMMGTEISGIYHWSSGQQYTKFEIMNLISNVCNLGCTGIAPDREHHSRSGHEDRRLLGLRLESLLDVSKFRTSLERGVLWSLQSFLPSKDNLAVASVAVSSVAGSESSRPGLPAAVPVGGSSSSGGFSGDEDPRPMLRRSLRNNKKVLQRMGSDIRKMKELKSHLHKEVERLQSLHPDQVEQLQTLCAREQALDEALNWKTQEEITWEEMGKKLQQELCRSPQSGKLKRLVLSEDEAGLDRPGKAESSGQLTPAPYAHDSSSSMLSLGSLRGSVQLGSSKSIASSLRQPRAESPAFDMEVERLLLENEESLKQLREENQRLKQLVVQKGLEEAPSPPASPRSRLSARSLLRMGSGNGNSACGGAGAMRVLAGSGFGEDEGETPPQRSGCVGMVPASGNSSVSLPSAMKPTGTSSVSLPQTPQVDGYRSCHSSVSVAPLAMPQAMCRHHPAVGAGWHLAPGGGRVTVFQARAA